jgi:acyl-[acyl-carrier-protein]-phospholipid O-acyltransferase/long-chain-fatty-acid--[acyl-carrier-protein] ligase
MATNMTDQRLHTEFIKVAKRHWGRRAMADSTGQDLTYGRALIGAMVLGQVIAKRTVGEQNVGVLLPASVGSALSNLATCFAGRTPVNLNFTIGSEALRAAVAQAGIRTILTSKRFLAKANLPEQPGMVFLEDLRGEIGALAKVAALLRARLMPVSWLARRYRGAGDSADTLATIIFSSGSTGVPKGVMITHWNILSNVDGLRQIFDLGPGDCFVGVLPLFHSFGFTGTFWFPLLMGCSVAYHPNPMDAKTVGELAERYRARMLISTPTFCQSYIRKCTPAQFAHLKYAIVGAEKLREPVALAFREKFGVDLLEGYGCTEMAPVVACNRPAVGPGGVRQPGIRPGSVGLPIPGVKAQVVDQHTGEGPLVDREGLLLVHGPNMMVGYLDQPERTSEVMRDGWYVTGDIARIDADGFIHITDRLSRFSKIGGEMVPHLKIEDAINDILGEVCCAVTAVPDDTRGERLVAFYTRRDVAPEALWDQLGDTELPKLWLPRRDNLVPIDEIPALGTGKTDLRRLKEMALALGAGR